jgi:uncharacterized tellurite resistance protein B-like protein
MLGRLKQFFEDHIVFDSNSGQDDVHALQLATAALLVEIMQSDDETSNVEQRVIVKTITKKFDLKEDEAQTLIDLAHDELKDSVDYFQFTNLINTHFEYEKRVKIIEHLWQVAFADGVLDLYEEHTVRKISELLHVRHSDFIAAKLKVSPD